MRRFTLLSAGLFLGALSASCSSISSTGTDQPIPTTCPEGQVCETIPGNGTDPYNIPPSGGMVSVGTSSSPYTPTSTGSTGVAAWRFAAIRWANRNRRWWIAG